MSRPVIGITISRYPEIDILRVIGLSENYTEAISRAGGAPMMIPLGLDESQMDSLLERVDGLLLTGGVDIDPLQYNVTRGPEIGTLDEDRDRAELYIIQKVINAGIPLLGICRGHQMINVAMGGTLYTDLPTQYDGDVRHKLLPGEPRSSILHLIEILPGTKLREIIGAAETGVNSIHHQGIRKLAPGLIPSAYAPDGLTEGFEIDDHPFGISVQWHPEWLVEHEPMQRLFHALVSAADNNSGT